MRRRRGGFSFRYRRRSGGSGGTYSSTHAPSTTTKTTTTKHSYSRPPKGAKGAAAKPHKTGTTTTTTSTKTGGGTSAVSGRESGYRSFTVSPPHVALTSTPSMVVLLLSALFVAATWDGFWKPFFTTLWTGNKSDFKTKVPGNLVLGGIVFIAVAGVGSSMSEESAGFFMLSTVGLWAVFLIMNQKNPVNTLESYLTQVNQPAGNKTAKQVANQPDNLSFYNPYAPGTGSTGSTGSPSPVNPAPSIFTK